MANRNTSSKKRGGKPSASKKRLPLETVILLVLAFLVGYYLKEAGVLDRWQTGSFGSLSLPEELEEGKAYFHFLDVGQGDASLLVSDGKGVVIDTGSASMADSVSQYINEYVPEVEYMILTHPHEDHMGSAAEVLRQVTVKNIILPDASSDAKFFSRFLDVAEEKHINVVEAVPGDTFTVGEMMLTILAPLADDYDSLNNYSVVTRVDVGETTVLFTGDAEREVEEALLDTYAASELDCDLFQAGHHGSSTSNTRDFISVLSPLAAVISCGKDNSYGHPHRETISTFEELGVEVFRTDEAGTVVFASDGKSIAKVGP